MKNSITIRLITIGILILLLLIPISMVKDLIREREYRLQDAIDEVSSKWGNSQTITGLILTVPYYSYTKVYEDDGKKYKLVKSTEYAHFLPEHLSIEGAVLPEIRYRGIYEVILYSAQLSLTGSFLAPNFEAWKIEEDNILWDNAFVSLGMSDLRGIQENISLQWNEQHYQFNPGLETNDVINNGITASVPVQDLDSTKGDWKFLFNG